MGSQPTSTQADPASLARHGKERSETPTGRHARGRGRSRCEERDVRQHLGGYVERRLASACKGHRRSPLPGVSKTYLKLKGAVRMKLTIARKSNTNVPSSEKTSGLLSGVGTLDAAHDIAVRPGESCAAVDTPRMHNCCAAKHHSAFGRFSVQCPGTSSPEGEGEGNRNNTAVGQPALAHLPSSDLSNLQTAIYSETNGLRSWVGDKYNSAIDPAPCIFKLLRNVETTPWTVRPKLSIGIQESPKP